MKARPLQVDWVVAEEIPGTFTFDSYFANAPVLNHIHGHPRAYVGDLKFNRNHKVRVVITGTAKSR